ncbi:MAG: glycosyltransferase family 2 protein [Bacteroidota bacterium]
MSEFNPLVSIIIPAYNCAKYIGDAIESAVNQTWSNKEIIVVNDGSTDNTLAVARQYESTGIVKVVDQENKGACNARNNGYTISQGQFIQYLDGDDILALDKIEKQLGILKDNPDCIISCKWVRFNGDISQTIGIVGPHQSISKDLLPIDWILIRHTIIPHCWLFSRAIHERTGGWNETLTCNQDTEFFLRAVVQSKMVMFCQDTIAYYRTVANENSISKLNSADKFASLLKVGKIYKAIVNNLAKDTPEAKISIGNYFKELEYKFYPDYPELVKECEDQPEIKFANIEYDSRGKFSFIYKLLGWRSGKKIHERLKKIVK